jgi:hypothetical protein
MREAAVKHLRTRLDALDLDGVEVTTLRYDLKRERVAEVVAEAIEAKVAAGALLDAIRLSQALGVGDDLVHVAATGFVDRVGDGSRHEELVAALEVARAAGLRRPTQRIATRLFRQRYGFTRLMPSYDYLLETLHFAVDHGLSAGALRAPGAAPTEPWEADAADDVAEGLVRILAYHAGRDSLDEVVPVFDRLGVGEDRLPVLVDAYLARITAERAPWHLAVVRVARRFGRGEWLAAHADEVVENALVHGAAGHAEALAAEHGPAALRAVVARFRGLVEAP